MTEGMIWVSQVLEVTDQGEKPRGPVIFASTSKDACIRAVMDWLDLPGNFQKSVATRQVPLTALLLIGED